MNFIVRLSLILIINLYPEIVFANTLECICVNYDDCNYDYSSKGPVSDYHELLTYEDGEDRPSCSNAIDVCCDLSKGNNNADTSQPKSTSTPKPAPTAPGKWICGHRKGDDRGFGANANARRGEFPWMVAVLRKDSYGGDCQAEGSYHCGGSLINEKAVLTSAKEVHKVRAADLIVRVGSNNWQPKNEPHQDLKVDSIHIHPNFDPESFVNNYALLILAEPAKSNGNVNSICLENSHNNYDKSECIETGWGESRAAVNQNSCDQRGCSLKKSELNVIPSKTCENVFRMSYDNNQYKLKESILCAGDDRLANPCTGNGGSPIICPLKSDKGRYVQVGIASIAVCNKKYKPGLYADVTAGSQWINRIIKSRGLNSNSYNAH